MSVCVCRQIKKCFGDTSCSVDHHISGCEYFADLYQVLKEEVPSTTSLVFWYDFIINWTFMCSAESAKWDQTAETWGSRLVWWISRASYSSETMRAGRFSNIAGALVSCVLAVFSWKRNYEAAEAATQHHSQANSTCSKWHNQNQMCFRQTSRWRSRVIADDRHLRHPSCCCTVAKIHQWRVRGIGLMRTSFFTAGASACMKIFTALRSSPLRANSGWSRNWLWMWTTVQAVKGANAKSMKWAKNWRKYW